MSLSTLSACSSTCAKRESSQAVGVIFGKCVVSKDLAKGDFSSWDAKAAAMTRLRARFAQEMGTLPVVGTDAVGHGPVNEPVPLGTPSTLGWSSGGRLELACDLGALTQSNLRD